MTPTEQVALALMLRKNAQFPPVPPTQRTPATRPVPPGPRRFAPIPPPPPIPGPGGGGPVSPEVTTAYPPAPAPGPADPRTIGWRPPDPFRGMAAPAEDPTRFMAPMAPSAPAVPLPRPRPAAAPAPAAPPEDLSWFRRNAFRQRDRESGDYLDPTLASRAGPT